MHEQSSRDSVSLSDRVKAIILGSLLGDGSLKLNEGYKNARFSFRHSIVREEYFRSKTDQLKEISSEANIFRQKRDGGYSMNEKLRYQSRALESLTELYRLTHKRKRFLIRRKWLNMLTPLSLAVWWQDDGSIVGNARKGVLCTDGFEEDSVILLAQYLEKVWKVRTHVGAIGRRRDSRRSQYYRLWFSTEELKKFLRIILPHIKVASMLPKVILIYNDPELQERWISEVVALTSFPREIVEQMMQQKKNKWKSFRE
ncbi:MAG: uncharacterized protein HW383_574 [Candidatus Magasanikbacteria bacterium]|nr:uncharacterized protein [Candidatus Magasanikbacteria bacterium]